MFLIQTSLHPDVESAVAPATEEEETPSTSLMACTLLLVIVTMLIGVTSEFLVGSIDGLSTSTGLPKEFIRVVLKPVYMARSDIAEGPIRIFSVEHPPGAHSDPYIWLHSPFTQRHIYWI